MNLFLSAASCGGEVGKGMLSSSCWDPVARKHRNVSKLCQGKFRLDFRKLFFTECVAKHWIRLPREVIDAQACKCPRGVR